MPVLKFSFLALIFFWDYRNSIYCNRQLLGTIRFSLAISGFQEGSLGEVIAFNRDSGRYLVQLLPPGALRCQRRRLRRLRRPRPCRSSRAVSPCRSPLRSRCPSWCCCKICGLRWKEPWDLPWRRQISFEQNHDESTLVIIYIIASHYAWVSHK